MENSTTLQTNMTYEGRPVAAFDDANQSDDPWDRETILDVLSWHVDEMPPASRAMVERFGNTGIVTKAMKALLEEGHLIGLRYQIVTVEYRGV